MRAEDWFSLYRISIHAPREGSDGLQSQLHLYEK